MDEGFGRSLFCGAVAGLAVDLTLYPLDTIKTRLQTTVVHACSASVSELVACIVRVPTELVKQRAQAMHARRLRTICAAIYRQRGTISIRGFYQGFCSTVLREVPFSLIEFPAWEALKQALARIRERRCTPPESAACGSLAGCFAAALTTPLDVAKTRIMLNENSKPPGILSTVVKVWNTSGYRGLYAGALPRSVWMGVGGFVFFGAFETAMLFAEKFLP
ncbi:unnamed protein product [Gongylonema pulchrum]|uniref:S-adenosylmethionine mitochondrial carrier protein n=1 Tax=Gongylonema pulchrum TaxID=637853 RepID=A0A183CZB2_9BILA|nr:unnamed protein product [Gongylonema pulchrum]